MKKTSTIFLQIVITLIGIVALIFLILEPRMEGVNANATSFQIYSDPFILLVYAGAIPFFIALYQAIKILGHVRRGNVFSDSVVRALRTIKYCALTIVGFVVVEEIWIMLTHGNDDAAGAFMIGLFIALGSIVVATVATMFEKTVQSAVDLKSENDLTV